MIKQTAIDWLISELEMDRLIKEKGLTTIENIIDKAKEMEKQQIIDAFDADVMYSAKKYYEKTYGSDK